MSDENETQALRIRERISSIRSLLGAIGKIQPFLGIIDDLLDALAAFNAATTAEGKAVAIANVLPLIGRTIDQAGAGDLEEVLAIFQALQEGPQELLTEDEASHTETQALALGGGLLAALLKAIEYAPQLIALLQTLKGLFPPKPAPAPAPAPGQ